MNLTALTRSPRLSRRWEIGVVALALAILLGSQLWIGLRTGFLPCTLDCGETYEAYVQARNLDRFGWRSAGGFQDFAEASDPAAHPSLYIHNPNLTSLPYLLLLFKLGIRDVHAQAPWFALPFLLGLAYLYFAVRLVTGDGLLAGLCLLNAVSLYLLVDLWGFHAHRSWSWVVTWGTIYHLKKAFQHAP